MHIDKHTKIIATIGPSCDSPKMIEDMIQSGVNIFRFNTKHNTTSWHLERIKRVQNISQKLNTPIGILVDLQGPEIRIQTENHDSIEIQKGGSILFKYKDFTKPQKDEISSLSQELEDYPVIYVPTLELISQMELEDVFSIDDGSFEFEVTKKVHQGFIAKCLDNGIIKTQKTLNLIGKNLDLPSLTPEDKQKIETISKLQVDFIALSFVRDKEDVETLRKQIQKNRLKARIVSKIESASGVDNIDEIIDASDVVMIARGDLGVEMPLERIAYLQKEIIKKCREKSKQVIVATQMLHSMTENSRPTRAEATDVSNAVYDGADAVMLSAESAVGKHPVKVVEVMKRILKFNEDHSDPNEITPKIKDNTNALVKASISLINDKLTNIDKVVVFTETGYSAHVFSGYRCNIPLIAISDSSETVRSLTLDYGVMPVFTEFPKGEFSFKGIQTTLVKQGYLKSGDMVLVIHGKRWKDSGKTNALFVLQT